MPSAAARHILVNTEEECLKLKNEIEAGTDFSPRNPLRTALQPE